MAAVTRPKSGPDQLEDLLRRLLMAVDTPAPIPEVPAVEKLLQRLVAETQSILSPVVSPPESVGLEKMLRSFLSGQQRTRPPPREDSGGGGGRVIMIPRCPYLTVTLLARLAHMLQGALLAQRER